MANLEMRTIRKLYPNGFTAVQGFDLAVNHGEFIVLVGPSGCGKTTTLRMIAGLEEISEGELLIGGVLANEVQPKDRDIAMVFQNYALYPHLTVYDNLAFSLKLKKVNRDVIDSKIHEVASLLGIESLLGNKPRMLSGGEMQRVAIGRAMMREPKVFLMDEPLSNLDAKLRAQMRREIIKLRAIIDTTFIYVTHDQVEAMTLADRIVVMKDGFIQQVGTPSEVFYHPRNLFVAGFIGTPQMNFFTAAVDKTDQATRLCLLGGAIDLPAGMLSAVGGGEAAPAEVTLGIRPEHISVRTGDADTTGAFAFRVEISEMMGSEAHLHLRSGDGSSCIACVPVEENGAARFVPGSSVYLSFKPEHIHLFDVACGENLCR